MCIIDKIAKLRGDFVEDEKQFRETTENQISDRESGNISKSVLGYVRDLVYLLGVILIAFLIFFRVVVVSGPSMQNTLVDGDYLVDDRAKNGAGEFKGEWIQFGSQKFPDWESILKYLLM